MRNLLVLVLALGVGGCRPRRPVEVRMVARWPGATAERVEQSVMVPLERVLAGMAGLQHLDGAARTGVAELRAVLAPGADRLQARLELRARLQEAELPEGVTPMLGPDGRIVVRYAIEGSTFALGELRRLSDWELGPALRTVPGVADVDGCGGGRRRVDVRVDEARRAALGVTVAEVSAALAPGRLILRVRGDESPGQLELRRVAVRRDVPVLIRDLARVEVGVAPPECLALVDGVPSVVGAVIAPDGADAREVVAAVRARLATVPLPAGVRVRTFGVEDEVRWRIALPAGARPDELARLAGALAGAARRVPGAPSILVEVGLRDDGDALEPPAGEARVIAATADRALVERLDHALAAAAPGAALLEVAGSSAGALRGRVLRVAGSELAGLRQVAQALAASLGGAAVEGAGDASSVEVVPDRAALARRGLAVADLEETVEAATAGRVVGVLAVGTERLDVVLHLGPGGEGPELLSALQLDAPDGGRVPLSAVAALHADARPAVILRRDARRCLRLHTALPPGAPLPSVPLPPGVTLEWE